MRLSEIEVIAPNLKRRLSGVTATIARLVPLQARRINIVATGPGLPADLPHVPLWKLPFLPRRRWRVWHARRNSEMLLGLALKYLLGRRLRLLFTSASQRHHTRFTKWLIARMDAIVATSDRTATYLDRPAEVILHGIDTERFSVPADRRALRLRLGVPDGILLGCYGRIRHQKGTDVFVDAMIEVADRCPGTYGLVMGRATGRHVDFLKELQHRVSEAGLKERILFLPEVSVEEMVAWYQVLDLFVAPQRWEGFGLTPLEAMACGVPAIAGKVGAFESQIEDGKTGAIIDSGDPTRLAEVIAELVSDRERLRQMGVAAREHVEANFRIEGEAAALVAVYRRLLAID